MILTMHTDPKSIMLEGRPEIEIVAISDRNYHDPQGRVAVYIEHAPGLDKEWQAGTSQTSFRGHMGQSTHTNVFYKPDGTLSPSRFDSADHPLANWPRIVPRRVLDATKPIGVRRINPSFTSQAELDAREYKITGRILPAVGDEPEVFLIEGNGGSELKVDPRTGRTVNRGGVGSNLEFFNMPDVVTEMLSVWSPQLRKTIFLTVTITDGVLTNLEQKD